MLFIGGIIGNMASVTNPYATGIAVSIINNPDLSLGTGILLRIVLFVLLYVIGTFVVVRYAENVRRNPEARRCTAWMSTLLSAMRESRCPN